MSEKYNNYLLTDYWKAVSDAVKKRAGYRCQLCNSQHDLAAHHRCYDHRGKELEHLDDLTCLCRRCHQIFHGKMEVAAPVVVARMEKKHRPEKHYLPKVKAEYYQVDSAEMVLVTPENHRQISCQHESWHWLQNNGYKPQKKGWASRVIGHYIPMRYLWLKKSPPTP